MAARALPLLCILLLVFSTSLVVLPSTGAARTLDESKAGGMPRNGALNPNRPPCLKGSCNPGHPYTRPCTKPDCPP